MAKSETTFLAIGGGDIAEADGILDVIFDHLGRRSDPRMVVMTVATSQEEEANKKYGALFRKGDVHHVEMVNISERKEAFDPRSVKKVERADAIFFTGGDQRNVPVLMGGSPVELVMKERIKEGIMIAGTSAGAAMMSASMITGGEGTDAPRLGGVKLAPGMSLVPDTIIDTHFSQRGRHGRLLTAIAHDPRLLGIGLDEKTGMLLQANKFRVVGSGSVTAIDGRKVSHTDLVDRREGDPIGILDLCMHVLPAGYSFDMDSREPEPPRARAAH
jgi:cyanophycinase